MRNDLYLSTFTGVGDGTTVGSWDVRDVDKLVIGVKVTAITGSPSGVTFYVRGYVDGTTEDLAVRKSSSVTVSGTYSCDMAILAGNAFGEIDNTFTKVKVTVSFSGGSSPTATGTVFLTAKRR